MINVNSSNQEIKLTVSSGAKNGSVNVSPDMSRYYTEKSKENADKAKEWAISDKIVDNEDYSSKYYAQKSKEQAQISTDKTTEVVNSGNEALSNIEIAKDGAIADITNQETLSVENVNNTGISQINNIKTEGAKQVTLATNQANIATEQATTATTQASIATAKTAEVVERGNIALENISTAKDNALNEINTTGAGYVNNAEQYAQNALTNANNASVSEANALSYKNSALESSQTATEQANIAITNANKAVTSATNAKTSETNAKSSEVRCEEILSKIGTAIKIKGRVDSFGDLPLSGNLDGDAYLVGEEGLDSYPEYYWYQDHWEFLGTTGGGGTWGTITGDITAQSDLIDKLNAKQNVLTAGPGIDITNNVISNTQTSAEWGNIQGTLSNQTDLQNILDNKQDVISDLEAIREGASKGSTALQTETDPIYTADKANIANVNLSNITDEAIQVIKDNSGGIDVSYDVTNESIIFSSGGGSSGGGGATLDNYLPNGTVINVNLDGSGDFTDLPSAIDYLTDKFSSGTVTIQLGAGTFELSAVLTIDTNKFTFGQLKIVGSGIDTTTIYKATSSEYTAMIYVQNSGTVYFQDFTIKSDNTNYGRGIEPRDFSNVVCDKLAFEGFAHAAIYVERGATCMLGKYINLKKCLNAVLVNGAWFTTMYGSIFNCTSGVTTIATVQQGGLVQLVRCYYTGSPSKATSQTIGSVSANGFITGSITKQS